MSITILTVALCATCAVGAQKVSNSDVTDAIEKITIELEKRHDEQLCWDPITPSQGWLHRHIGTTTAITTLAMLSAGQSVNMPSMQRSIDFIWEVEEPSSYLLSLRISIWALLPDTFEKRLKQDTKLLLRSMSLEHGGWSMLKTPQNSDPLISPLTREFGVIALRDAHQRGIRIPKKYWISIANAALGTQNDDGGWSYSSGGTSGKSSTNMTVAGLNCLLGIDESCVGDLRESDTHRIHGAIERALEWLDNNATTKNTGGTALMSYLYALERVAMACGLSEVRGNDWYVDGCLAVLESHCGKHKAKGSTVNLAFALLFLSRGDAPIAMSELVHQKSDVDEFRVSDEITKQVSHKVERALSWRLVTSNESISSWLLAPFMLIQNHEAIQGNTPKYQEYIERGGMIVMLATGNNLEQLRKFAQELCPKSEPIHFQRKHWGHSLLEIVENVHLWTWNDGVRDQVIVIQGNGKTLTRSKNSSLAKLLVNICCGNVELDRWKTRLHEPIRFKPVRKIIIAKHNGQWDAELSALRHWRTEILEFSEMKKNAVVWVGGIQTEEVTTELVSNIIDVAQNGSTVIVESIGGRGHFARTTHTKILERTKTTSTPNPLLVPYPTSRGWSMLNRVELPVPCSTSIGKGMVIFIDCDIRNALLQQTSWEIHGYSHESAIELVSALLCK
jgi:hypothetical protein